MFCIYFFNWQPQYGDAAKSLPKPLPIPVSATHLPKNKEAEEEEEAEDKEVVFLLINFLLLLLIFTVFLYYHSSAKKYYCFYSISRCIYMQNFSRIIQYNPF
jgi:hypothetical protein